MRHQPYRQQRVAAEFEEMILAPDAFNAQQTLPDSGQRLFGFPLRGLVAVADKGAVVRGRQRLAIDLAVLCQRDLLQPHIRRRHHIARQALCQLRFQFVRRDFTVIAGVVGQQLLRRADSHHGVGNAGTGGQRGGDFTGLDAKTTNFDLIVITAQIVDSAVGIPATQITGPVQACIGSG